MELTVDVKLDLSGFKPIERTCEVLSSTSAISGVIEADAETLTAARLNEYGGKGVYTDGKYAGEEVDIPPRSFVRAPAEIHGKEIGKKGASVLQKGFTEGNALNAIEIMGEEIEKAQKAALENNGSGIPNWLPHNEQRTIETKGFDRPLWSRRGETFPISHKVVTK